MPDLRAIVEMNADGIVIVDEAGIIRFTNPAAATLFGRDAALLAGAEFGFPLTVGEPAEVQIVRPGGELVTAELRAARIRWEGEPSCLVTLRDVTDRKQAEEKARELARAEAARAEAEAAALKIGFLAEAGTILASSLDYGATLTRLARLAVPFLADFCLVHVRDEGGEIPQVAAAHRDAAGDALLRELGQRYRVDPESPESVVARVARTGQPELYPQVPALVEAYVTRDPDTRELWSTLAPTSLIVVPLAAHERVRGTLTLATSVSGRCYGPPELELAGELARRAALAVENARLFEQAQEASRAKSNFLAVMSHELRTPLNAVIGYTDLLQAEIPGPVNARQEGHLARIKASSMHLLQIVDEILTFTRMEAHEERVRAVEVDLTVLLEEVAALVEPLARERGLALRTHLPSCPVRMRTDPRKVKQVVLNLLSNAVKFTEQGQVELSALPHGDAAFVRVRDTGVGIPPEHLERIFEPFWQVEQTATRVAEGTGLGLSVARRLARLLGGDVTVESTPGVGTTFTVRLPLATAEVPGDGGRAPEPTEVLSSPARRGRSGRVIPHAQEK